MRLQLRLPVDRHPAIEHPQRLVKDAADRQELGFDLVVAGAALQQANGDAGVGVVQPLQVLDRSDRGKDIELHTKTVEHARVARIGRRSVVQGRERVVVAASVSVGEYLRVDVGELLKSKSTRRMGGAVPKKHPEHIVRQMHSWLTLLWWFLSER
jgi:hypothetical protein